MHDHTPRPNGHPGTRYRGRLRWALLLTAAYTVIEMSAAFAAGSLALVSDAGHMVADTAALGVAYAATTLAKRPDRSGRRTYGYYRLEMFAALFSALLMLGVGLYVAISAWDRWGANAEVEVGLMFAVGLVGLSVNIVAILLLRGGAQESLNLKGAYQEVLADALGSIAVMVGAALIWFTDDVIWDTLLGLAIGGFVVVRAISLARQVLSVLGQHAPSNVHPADVQRDLAQVDGVQSVHDLHLWTLTSGMNVATAHLVSVNAERHHQVLDAASELLRTRYGIAHATLQVEPADHTGCDQIDW